MNDDVLFDLKLTMRTYKKGQVIEGAKIGALAFCLYYSFGDQPTTGVLKYHENRFGGGFQTLAGDSADVRAYAFMPELQNIFEAGIFGI